MFYQSFSTDDCTKYQVKAHSLMWRFWFAWLAILCCGCASTAPRTQALHQRASNLAWDVNSDHFNYYTPRSLGVLAVGVGFGAALANTPADDAFANLYQKHFRSQGTNDVSGVLKPIGDGGYIIPAFFAASFMGEFAEQGPLDVTGDWGERCWRSTLVGAPSLLFLQVATGASRPNEASWGSTWQPFNDANGVSGHAFMGAMPFLNAAKMTDDPWLKAGCYVASTAVGWSRINDNAHYTSQVVMGWWIANLAASAVDGTFNENSNWSIQPIPMGDGAGALVTLQY